MQRVFLDISSWEKVRVNQEEDQLLLLVRSSAVVSIGPQEKGVNNNNDECPQPPNPPTTQCADGYVQGVIKEREPEPRIKRSKPN